MALSKEAVVAAYRALHQIKISVLPDLQIASFLEDTVRWHSSEWIDPPTKKLLGGGEKSDGGWEELIFFVTDPSDELKAKFDAVKDMVPNSSISGPYSKNSKYWLFGWF